MALADCRCCHLSGHAMSYIYDSSTRTYRSTSTSATKATTAVKRVTAKVYSKIGSQVAPTASFYQSATRVAISSQAQTKLASGVKTSLQDALNVAATANARLPDATIELTGGFGSLAALTNAQRSTLANMTSSNAYGGSIKSFRLPSGTSTKLDLTTANTIGPDLLKKVDGNFSLELTPTELTSADNLSALANIRSAIGDRLTKFSIAGSDTSASVSAAAVRALGPAVWAKYGGALTVSDSVASVTQSAVWNDLRVLNNYRSLSFSVPDGIPAGTTSNTDLKQFDFSLDYPSFISGYTLLKGMSRQTISAAFTTDANNTDVSQAVSVAGKLLNRDHFKIEIAPVGGSAVTIPLSPLTISPAMPTQERVHILAKAVDEALRKDGRFDGIAVTSSGNKISLSAADPAFSGNMQIGLLERGENDVTNFVDVTNVPIYGLTALANVPELRSIAVTTSFAGLRSNWDSLTAFNAKTPLANITIPGSGDLLLTAQETKKYLPIIEKISDRKIIISDAPYAISTYSNFTEAASNKLATSIDLTGTVADLVNGADGIAALCNTGKVRSLKMTDASTSVISLTSEAAIALGKSLSTLDVTAKIQITDRPNMAQAIELSKLARPTNNQPSTFSLVGNFVVETDGTDVTANGLITLDAIKSSIASVNITAPTTLEKVMMLTARNYKASPVKVVDSASAISTIVQARGAVGFTDGDLAAIISISATGPLAVNDAKLVNASRLSNKLLSGLQVTDTSTNLAAGIADLVALKAAGRLRSLTSSDTPSNTLITALQTNGLSSFLV